LPVIDSVAGDYLDQVAFLAVAGRAPMDRTAERAPQLFSDNLKWGLDEEIWRLYGVPGQPASVMIAHGVIVDQWFGAIGEDELRLRLDELVALGS
jgi:hypothetical protein